MKLLLGGLICGGLALYLLILGLAWWFQDALTFPADRTSAEDIEAHARSLGLEPFWVSSADGTRIMGLHSPGRGQGAVIFHHGNGGGVLAAATLAAYLPGVDVYSFSYRGYPGSDPAPPREDDLIADARAIWDQVGRSFPPEKVVVHGQSLGGGVVHGLLMDVAPPAAVVLDSTFTSARDVARAHYGFLPVDLLFRHHFPSLERAPRVRSPVLAFHGTADDLIPFAHAETLCAALPDCLLVPVPGRGHQHWLLDEPQVQETYRRFVLGHLDLL